MSYEWIDQACLALPGAAKDYQPEWEAYRFLIGGKMFAMQGGDKAGLPILTLKLEPLKGEALRNAYADVVPGYYMNKQHWNSFYLEGLVPQEIMEQALKESYELVLRGLPKRVQKQIEETK